MYFDETNHCIAEITKIKSPAAKAAGLFKKRYRLFLEDKLLRHLVRAFGNIQDVSTCSKGLREIKVNLVVIHLLLRVINLLSKNIKQGYLNGSLWGTQVVQFQIQFADARVRIGTRTEFSILGAFNTCCWIGRFAAACPASE